MNIRSKLGQGLNLQHLARNYPLCQEPKFNLQHLARNYTLCQECVGACIGKSQNVLYHSILRKLDDDLPPVTPSCVNTASLPAISYKSTFQLKRSTSY
jgi:hypothetical protein